MAVPGSPLDPRHRGTNQLLREGATLVESAADVLDAVAPLLRHAAPRRMPGAPDRPALTAVAAAPPPHLPVGLPAGLEGLLGPEPLAVDELVRRCMAPLHEVQSALLELE